MFDKKKQTLFEDDVKKTSSDVFKKDTMIIPKNPFLKHAFTETVKTKSGNFSEKLSTSGSNFVDDFATISQYREPRSYEQIDLTMNTLWSQDPELAIKELFYIRMITRIVQFPNKTKTKNPQRGQGLKHEGIVRMIWVAINHPETFWKNISLFISIGSWKDIIEMLSYDLEYNGWKNRKLNWNIFGLLISAGLENPNTSELLKKYLPFVKANSQCKTLRSQSHNLIGKWICSIIFGAKNDEFGHTYKKYRKLKNSGTAHDWQKLISQGKFLSINFDTIHGRALSQLVSSKFLKNQKLEEKYKQWIESKPVAKFTGYVYELIQSKSIHSLTDYQKHTINAQFNKLVEEAKKGLTNQGIRPISVLDCSGSMLSPMYIGNGKVGKLTSIEVAVSSALFFDEMYPDSIFKNYYLGFSSKCNIYSFTGNNFVEKYFNTRRQGYGGTNFQSVFDMFSKFKIDNYEADEKLIPNFIVCFSDGEFDGIRNVIESNVKVGRQKLLKAGYSKEYCESFGICFVDLPNNFYSSNRKPKFETFANEKNVFYFSGYDLSPLAFLFGVEGKSIDQIPRTAEELFLSAMDQEVLNMIEV